MNASRRFCALLILVSSASFAQVRFVDGSFADASTRATAEKKVVMVDFYTSWCKWCKVLDRETYSSEDVGRYATEHFVSIKIDAEHGEGVALAQRFGVHGYPTILFVKDDAEVDRVVGYEPAAKFLESMTNAVEGGLAGLAAQFEKQPDASLALTLAQRYAERNDRGSASRFAARAADLDPDNVKGIAAQAGYVAASTSPNDSAMRALVVRYPETDIAQQARMTIATGCAHVKKAEDAEKYFEEFLSRAPNDASAMNAFAWICAEAGVNLERAYSHAAHAVALTPDSSTRAGYLDTQAEACFKLTRCGEAVRLEQKALDLLGTDKKDLSLRAQLKLQLRKFELAAAAGNSKAEN